MEHARSWNRRGGEKSEAGYVGNATLVAPDGVWTLDGKPLPEASIRRLLDQALSPLTDSFAGDYAIADAQAHFAETKEDLWNGTVGVRGGGGVDPITAEIRLIVGAAIRKADKGRDEKKWPALRDAKATERNAALDAAFERQKPKMQADIRAQAEAAVARKAEEAKRRAEAGEEIGAKIAKADF